MAILIVGTGGYATIQLAVDAASDGDTIVVSAGIYVEQVIVSGHSNLTIIAAAGEHVVMQAPADLVETARSSGDREIHAVFTVVNGSAVTLQNVTVDGHGAGNTVDEGGGAGIANFYGVYYRNASGTLTDVDITGVRDRYPGGLAAGGQRLVDGVQRGVALVVDNDTLLAFTMHGGTIDDFQKQAGTFVRADLDISGVTVLGGGAQTVIAQNGFSINRSTGTVSGNTITGIGYAGTAAAYSGGILASSNTNLIITGNIIGGSNVDNVAAKVVGIWIYQNGPSISGGEISGNTISYTDVGIAVDNSIEPNGVLIENNSVTNADMTDPYSAGVRFEPTPLTLTTSFKVEGTQMHDTLSGNAGRDVLSGLGGADLLSGGAGGDVLDGGTGADRMTGGLGHDIYYVDEVGDQVIEASDEGKDEVRTSLASYTLGVNLENLTGTSNGGQTLTGNGATNVITGAGGSDTLVGGGGNDLLNGGAGADAMYGGAGNDTYTVDDPGDLASEESSAGVDDGGLDTVKSSVTFTLGANLEYLTLTGVGNVNGTGNDLSNYIRGNEGANIISGLGERDLLYGYGGADQLFGGEGNDTLDGGAGIDTMTGGTGSDSYYVDDSGDIIVEQAGEGIDFVTASVSYTLSDNVDVLTLTGSADLDGTGNAGANTLSGNAGNNLLSAAAGNDTLEGGAGNDILVGGAGRDTLTGGAGSDTFRFDDGESGKTTGTRDWVKDFSHAEGDMIDLSPIDANTATVDDDAFSFIGSSAFSRTAGELRMVAEGANWVVQGDVNGDGIADFAILVTAPAVPPAINDFVL